MIEVTCPMEAVFGGADEERYPCTYGKGHDGPHSYTLGTYPPSAADLADAASTLQRIKDAVAAHEAPGHRQWYVDELVIDCDAEEFWSVAGQALQEYRKARTLPARDEHNQSAEH